MNQNTFCKNCHRVPSQCGCTHPHPDNLGLAESIIKQQELKITELEKQLDIRTRELIGASFYEHDYKTMMANNEPVAWMCPTGLEYKQRATDFMYNDALYDTKKNWIPLYTHSVKEMSETRIKQIFVEQTGFYFDDNPADDLALMDFAKALLLEAQEK